MIKVEPLKTLHDVVGSHELHEEPLAKHIAGGAVLAVVALVPAPLGSAVVGLLLHYQAHHAMALRAALFT